MTAQTRARGHNQNTTIRATCMPLMAKRCRVPVRVMTSRNSLSSALDSPNHKAWPSPWGSSAARSTPDAADSKRVRHAGGGINSGGPATRSHNHRTRVCGAGASRTSASGSKVKRARCVSLVGARSNPPANGIGGVLSNPSTVSPGRASIPPVPITSPRAARASHSSASMGRVPLCASAPARRTPSDHSPTASTP